MTGRKRKLCKSVAGSNFLTCIRCNGGGQLVLLEECGSGGIRTHGEPVVLEDVLPDGFRDRCIKPLCHASEWEGRLEGRDESVSSRLSFRQRTPRKQLGPGIAVVRKPGPIHRVRRADKTRKSLTVKAKCRLPKKRFLWTMRECATKFY